MGEPDQSRCNPLQATGQTSKLIAIIDHDDSIQHSLQDVIESTGLVARCFGSAAEFLESDLHRRAARVIAEICMPKMTGLELQARLKEEECNVLIIFITVHGDCRMRIRAMREGTVEFLTKPFDRQVLLETLGRATFSSCRTQWNETNWFRLSALAVIGLLVADIHRWRLHQGRYGSQSELKA